MKAFKRYTVTAALPYANGPLHIGHIAGAYLPSDIYVRYLRMNDKDVIYVCGSDENGAAITIKARQEGIHPQELVDKNHEHIKKSFERFGMSFDIYHRTSSKLHHETASDFFKQLYDNGVFTREESEQYYDEDQQQFLADRYIKGTCPRCGYEEAYGDQCEKCGSSLSPKDLINPVSTLSGKKPVLRTTKHWYMPLNEYEDWLREWILEGHKSDWKPNVYGQCKSWLDTGLQPRAVTRDLDWGVPVPLPDAEGKVIYVWIDAPVGYISATKAWAEKAGKDWKPYWQDEATKLVHFIGKDNIVFHCIIFPVMLKAHGKYILPDNVPANEFLNLEGDKISTSRNYAVWLHEYLDEFPGKQDVMRYALCANLPENKDNDFSWKDFQAKNNNELVAILGNFINRVLVLTHKYFDGKVPAFDESKLTDLERELLKGIQEAPKKVGQAVEHYKFREAQAEFMNLARLGNKYLTETEPWKLIREDEEKVKMILNKSIQLVANLAVVGAPFLPFSSEKILKTLNLENNYKWEDAGHDQFLEAGHLLNQPEHLFNKIEDKVIEEQLEKLAKAKASKAEAETNKVEAQKEAIEFDDFVNMDLRVGTVLQAEKVEKSNKLLKFLVDMGYEKRTIVSGVAKYYKPEELLNKQVIVVANLKPRQLFGIESKGMILFAEDIEGNLKLVSPIEKIEAGSIVK